MHLPPANNRCGMGKHIKGTLSKVKGIACLSATLPSKQTIPNFIWFQVLYNGVLGKVTLQSHSLLCTPCHQVAT